MQHDQTNTAATSIALADAVQAWNGNPACRAKMELVYEGSTRVRTADDVLVVRGEFFALGVTDHGPLDALWIELQTSPQRPRYVTRDHRPENGLAGTRSVDIFIWQDTLDNMNKIIDVETIVANKLTQLKEQLM
ncbi:hypothetical protein E2386_02695 [Salmonella enterica subsp. enterica serovar Enteritidis]|nr:hypothetical protein [Salmonella enterica subsp. enterica serovar Enteritidis]